MPREGRAKQAPRGNSPVRPDQPVNDAFRALLDGLNVGIANLLPSGTVLYCNDRFREILCIPFRAEIVGTDLKFHISPASWPALIEGLQQAIHARVEGGLTVANRIRQGGLITKILVFTTHSFPGIEKTLQAAGCNGYVLKQDASQELVCAAKEVLRGASYFHANSVSVANAESESAS